MSTALGLYSTRSRATERRDRIRTDMDRQGALTYSQQNLVLKKKVVECWIVLDRSSVKHEPNWPQLSSARRTRNISL
jgi:hypothetical protein